MWGRGLLSFFGIGFLPGPSGTWASAATVAVIGLAHGPSVGPLALAVLLCVGLGSLVTVALGGPFSRAAGETDPSWVVTDEVAGQALAIAIGASFSRGGGWWPILAAFALFRVFDIWKPGPVGAAERLPGGWGILADDLVAGALAGVLVVALRFVPTLGA